MAYLPSQSNRHRTNGDAMAVSGEKIKQAREALKTRTKGRQGSQAWLAAQIGAHVTSISDWERGANQPSPRHLAALATALGVTIESLMDSADDEESDEMVAVLMPSAAFRRLIREEMAAQA